MPRLKERGAALGSEINNSKTGLTLSMIMDGTSKTFSPAETRECVPAARTGRRRPCRGGKKAKQSIAFSY